MRKSPMLWQKAFESAVAVAICLAAFWFLASLVASSIKTSESNCGKSYPIDNIFYSDLFCEEKH